MKNNNVREKRIVAYTRDFLTCNESTNPNLKIKKMQRKAIIGIAKRIDSYSGNSCYKLMELRKQIENCEKYAKLPEQIVNTINSDIDYELKRFSLNLGYFLYEERTKKGLSYHDVSRITGVTKTTEHYYEIGRHYPTIEALHKRMEIYGLDDEWFKKVVSEDYLAYIEYIDEIIEDGRKKIGSFLRDKRISEKLTMTKLASLFEEQLGRHNRTTQAYIANCENGKVAVLSKRFKQFAAIYHTSPEKLKKEFDQYIKQENKKTIKEYLRKSREEKGLTIQELAEKAKISKKKIEDIESGKDFIKYYAVMMRYCNALDIEPGALIEMIEKEYSSSQKAFLNKNSAQYKLSGYISEMSKNFVVYQKIVCEDGRVISSHVLFAILEMLLLDKGNSVNAEELYFYWMKNPSYLLNDELKYEIRSKKSNIAKKEVLADSIELILLDEMKESGEGVISIANKMNLTTSNVAANIYYNTNPEKIIRYEFLKELRKVFEFNIGEIMILKNQKKIFISGSCKEEQITESEMLKKVYGKLRYFNNSNEYITADIVQEILINFLTLTQEGYEKACSLASQKSWKTE